MPKSISSTSIRTLWENNPDTPMSASNLSHLHNVTASYLNTDGYPDLSGYENMHVEGKILFADPNNTSRIILKRGTIIQIVNEAVDSEGTPVISKNSQYRIFDVGLEDIILTPSQTDNLNQNKSSWGSGTHYWFVYICDKDDNYIYNKNTPYEYGGGAEILISTRNDFPVREVPGRPQHNYSSGDTRLIGGFTTSGDMILENTIWDISGKSHTVAAKEYKILDEYASPPLYRKIDIRDLNTNNSSNFLNNITVQGDITATQNLSAVHINADSLILNTTLDVSSTASFNDATFNGVVTFNDDVNIISDINQDGDLVVNGSLFVNGTTNIVTVNSESNITTFNSDVSINGNIDNVGTINHSGNATVGGSGYTVYLSEYVNISGDTLFDGDITVQSQDGLTDILHIDQSTQNVILNSNSSLNVTANTTTINSDVTINGSLNLSSLGDNISLHSNIGISSSVGSGYKWNHLGSFTVEGGDNKTFVVQQNDSTPVFTVNMTTKDIFMDGDIDIRVPENKTFNVYDHNDFTIFGFENNTSAPEPHVAINAALDVSQGSAENALNVTGNANVSHNLTVGGTLFANIDGDASGSAASWSNDLTISFNGDVTGTAVFNGDEGSIIVPMQVADDSHRHDSMYYTKTELDGGQLNGVYYTKTAIDNIIVNHTHDYLAENDITFEFINTTRGLVGSGPEQIAFGNHIHDDYFDKTTDSATNVSFTGTIDGVAVTNVDEALNNINNALSNAGQSGSDVDVTYGDVIANSIEVSTFITSQTVGAQQLTTSMGKDTSGELNGLLFYNQLGDLNQIYTNSNSLYFFDGTDNKPVLFSTSDIEQIAPEAKKLDNPVSLTFSSVSSVGGPPATASNSIGDGVNSTVNVNVNTFYHKNLAANSISKEDSSLTEVWYKEDGSGFGAQLSQYKDEIAEKRFKINFLSAGGDNGDSNFAARSNHKHDDRYYTETEVNQNVDALIINILNAFGAPSGTSIINPFTGNPVNN